MNLKEDGHRDSDSSVRLVVRAAPPATSTSKRIERLVRTDELCAQRLPPKSVAHIRCARRPPLQIYIEKCSAWPLVRG